MFRENVHETSICPWQNVKNELLYISSIILRYFSIHGTFWVALLLTCHEKILWYNPEPSICKVKFISENGRFGYSTRTKNVLKLISLVWSCILILLMLLLSHCSLLPEKLQYCSKHILGKICHGSETHQKNVLQDIQVISMVFIRVLEINYSKGSSLV